MKLRSLLIAILALAALGGCTNQKPEPRKFGIGLKASFYSPDSKFEGIESKSESSINQRNTSIEYSQPIKIQLSETLINDYAYVTNNLDWFLLNENDMPPALRGKRYSELAEENKTIGGYLPDYELKKSDTGIEAFAEEYPEYASKINATSQPALSAEYSIGTVSFGRLWGVFLLSSSRHRWTTFGLGPTISYTEGIYSINVCNPYLLYGGDTLYRKGECKNKTNLTTQKISNLGLGYHAQVILYSYIGEKFEINVIDTVKYWNYPIVENRTPKHDPEISFLANQIVSVIYTF